MGRVDRGFRGKSPDEQVTAAFMSQVVEEAPDFARGPTSKQGWRRRAVLEAQGCGFPILAPHWLLNSASLGSRSCSSWEAMSSRLGTAEGERAVNVSPC